MDEPADLRATRSAYDMVAVPYAALLQDALAANTWDRAVLGAFAEVVTGPVVEVGCGPGRISAYLAGLGLTVAGIDLSPAMVAEARRRHPELAFTVGSFASLDVADGALGGIVAWYSIIHTPPDRLPAVFAEFRRALRGGGHLLLAFQAGDEVVHLTEAYGHTLSADAYRLPPDRIASLVGETGFAVEAQLVRAPGTGPGEKTPQAYLLARAG